MGWNEGKIQGSKPPTPSHTFRQTYRSAQTSQKRLILQIISNLVYCVWLWVFYMAIGRPLSRQEPWTGHLHLVQFARTYSTLSVCTGTRSMRKYSHHPMATNQHRCLQAVGSGRLHIYLRDKDDNDQHEWSPITNIGKGMTPRRLRL